MFIFNFFFNFCKYSKKLYLIKLGTPKTSFFIVKTFKNLADLEECLLDLKVLTLDLNVNFYVKIVLVRNDQNLVINK